MAELLTTLQNDSVQSRFWARVDVRGPNECWLWTGGMGSGTKVARYGRLFVSRGISVAAHRYSWELANGCKFPDGMNACHSCDNPACVNPAHIWPGTQSENIRDAVRKGRHASIKQTYCRYGHEFTPDNRVAMKGGGSRCKECNRIRSKERMRRFRAKKAMQSKGSASNV